MTIARGAPTGTSARSPRCRWPSPATRRDRHAEGSRAGGDIGGVLGAGLHIAGRHRAGDGISKGLLWVTKMVLPSGVSTNARGDWPTGCRRGPRSWCSHQDRHCVAAVLATKAVLLSCVNANPPGSDPRAISVGSLVLVLTSIVDNVSLPRLVTNPVLPSGVTSTSPGSEPTGMSVGPHLGSC